MGKGMTEVDEDGSWLFPLCAHLLLLEPLCNKPQKGYQEGGETPVLLGEVTCRETPSLKDLFGQRAGSLKCTTETKRKVREGFDESRLYRFSEKM